MRWPWLRRRPPTSSIPLCLFLLHLDATTSVRLRSDPDSTYSVTVSDRHGTTEVETWSQGGITSLFDAQLYLGVVLARHAVQYYAETGESPPYLADLQQRCVPPVAFRGALWKH